MNQPNFAVRLLHARTSAELSHRQLLKATGISDYCLRTLVGSPNPNPTMRVLVLLAKALHISLDELCGAPRDPVYQLKTIHWQWVDCSEQAYNTATVEKRILYR